MNTYEALITRRSVRVYDPSVPITEDQIHQILNAAMHAPSARNTRPWDFVVIIDPQDIKKVGSFVGGKQYDTATAVIIVVAVPDRQIGLCEGNHFNDCGSAALSITLAAWELGIGTCICGLYPVPERMKGAVEFLGLPDTVIPFCAIPMGIPAETPEEKGFYDEALVHQNRW